MNINNIGSFIAQLRKEANMTQSDVADTLHISHQAVSKWERLESLPDITMLPEIAKLFDISIDELLRGERSELGDKQDINLQEEIFIKDIATEKVEEAKTVLKNLENKTEILKEIAPIIKPKVLDEVMEEIEIDLTQIEDFLPFLGADLLDKIIKQALQGDKVNQLPEEIYPFLNKHHKDTIIDYYISHKGQLDIEGLYPFLSGTHKEKLIFYFFDTRQIEQIEDLYPFLSKQEKDIVIDRLQQAGLYHYIEDLMPFIDSEQKSVIIDRAMNEKVDKSIISNWAPFLNQEQLINIIKKDK